MHRQILTIKNIHFLLSKKAFSPTWQMGVKGYNWWETELPNNQEVLLNLKAHNFKIDYILTHTYPKSTVYYMNLPPIRGELDLTEFLQLIENQVSHKHWYFGHFHCEKKINKMMACLFFNMINLSNKKVIYTYYDTD